MNIIAVDDERPMLNILEDAIQEAVPGCSLNGFSMGKQALDYARTNQVNVAFLDIKMPGMSGLELAKHLKDINGQTNIIFVTGFSEYALDALALHISGYVMKPADAESISRELENLRHPVVTPDKGIWVQCFGSFGVFIDGQPLMFTQTKTKELLALLVHKRGALVTNAEIAAVLWEDRSYDNSLKSQTRNIIANLWKLLKDAGIGDILIRAWNGTAIDVSKVNCDYYGFISGKMPSVNTYTGEFMHEYSWAEFTAAELNSRTSAKI